MDKCLNCGAEVAENYCPICGQEKSLPRLEVKSLIHDFFHGVLHWENSILLIFRRLLISPGHSVKEYIAGKRKSYVKPLSFFLFFQTIYILVFHKLSERFLTAFTPSAITTHSKVLKIQKFFHLVNVNVNYLTFILVLIFAFFLKLFLKKKTGINYAESLVFSLYTMAITLMFGTVFVLLSVLDVRIWALKTITTIIYLTYAVGQFSGFSKTRGIVVSGAVLVLSYATQILIVLVIMFCFLTFFAH